MCDTKMCGGMACSAPHAWLSRAAAAMSFPPAPPTQTRLHIIPSNARADVIELDSKPSSSGRHTRTNSSVRHGGLDSLLHTLEAHLTTRDETDSASSSLYGEQLVQARQVQEQLSARGFRVFENSSFSARGGLERARRSLCSRRGRGRAVGR